MCFAKKLNLKVVKESKYIKYGKPFSKGGKKFHRSTYLLVVSQIFKVVLKVYLGVSWNLNT